MMEERFTVDENTVVHSFPSHYSVKDVLQRTGTTDRGDAFYIVNLERLVFLYDHVILYSSYASISVKFYPSV